MPDGQISYKIPKEHPLPETYMISLTKELKDSSYQRPEGLISCQIHEGHISYNDLKTICRRPKT